MGTIAVEQPLASGGVYELPVIGVINTGDQPATYSMKPIPTTGQKELVPEASWFSFTPESVQLEPGKSAPIQTRLSLPLKTPPGDYYVILMASPSQTATSSGANIAVAAGTKLRFTATQTNILFAIYYRIRDLMNLYSPWSWIILGVVVVLAIGIPLARRYRVSFGVERRSDDE
jgi:hypothetical protein